MASNATDLLIKHPGSFNGYVVIDPSMWYDNQGVLREVEKALKERRFDGTSLYLAMGNTLPLNMDTIQFQKDTSMKTLHPRSVFQYGQMVRRYDQNGLRSRFRYYSDDSHMSLLLTAEYDGLRFLFDFCRVPNSTETRFLWIRLIGQIRRRS